jgi:hypothetical protein
MKYLKKSARALTLALALLMATNSAHAADTYCYTGVRNLFIESNGAVQIRLDVLNNYVQICNINSSWKGITPQICAAQLGLMRSAVARQVPMYIYYASTEVTSCTTIPTYSTAPSPGYVMLLN